MPTKIQSEGCLLQHAVHEPRTAAITLIPPLLHHSWTWRSNFPFHFWYFSTYSPPPPQPTPNLELGRPGVDLLVTAGPPDNEAVALGVHKEAAVKATAADRPQVGGDQSRLVTA